MCVQTVINAVHAVNENILHTRKTYFNLMVEQQKALDIESLANLQHQSALARVKEETAAKIHMNQSRMEVGV
jgi:hypothetical protein